MLENQKNKQNDDHPESYYLNAEEAYNKTFNAEEK